MLCTTSTRVMASAAARLQTETDTGETLAAGTCIKLAHKYRDPVEMDVSVAVAGV